MTRVYISGPITGDRERDSDIFDTEERLLRECGDETYNPLSIVEPSAETQEEWEFSLARLRRYYMNIRVHQLTLCDEIRMLPSWQNDPDSVWEHRIAKMLGLVISYCPVNEVPKW